MSVIKTITNNYCLGFHCLPILGRAFWNATPINEMKKGVRDKSLALEIKKPYADLVALNHFTSTVLTTNKFEKDKIITSNLQIAGKLFGRPIEISELTFYNTYDRTDELMIQYMMTIMKPKHVYSHFRMDFESGQSRLIPDDFWINLDERTSRDLKELDEMLIEGVHNIVDI